MSRKSKGDTSLSPELLDKITITREDGEAFAREHLNYEVKPPEGTPRGKRQLWCPYCHKWVRFKHRQMGGYLSQSKKAECCGISDNDFWVKTHNKLWESLKGRK